MKTTREENQRPFRDDLPFGRAMNDALERVRACDHEFMVVAGGKWVECVKCLGTWRIVKR